MSARDLIESENPKDYAARIPSALDAAIDWAHAEYNQAVQDGKIYDAKSADETSSDIAQQAVEKFDLDDDDDNFDAVVTPLFARAGKEFPA